MPFLLRLLKRLGLIFLSIVVLYVIGRPTQKWLDGFYSGVREPYLQMMSSQGVTIRWQSEDAFLGVVRYGVKQDQLQNNQREAVLGEEHEVRLTGLKPATKYFYSVGDGVKEKFKGESFWFKTSPEIKAHKPVRFWVTGDQGYPGEIQTQVRNGMKSWLNKNARKAKNSTDLDFWMTTGDNAYRSGSNEQFQTGFFEPYKTILRNTPVWPVYGNHDARRWVFFDIFTFPEKAENGGVASGTEHYYSFDYANIHFVMLDTQEGDHDVDGEMLTWLKKDLKQTKQQWLITFFHHPPYTKGSHDSDNKWDSRGRLITVRENILPILEKAGVDLVFSGHSHMYERSELINCHYGDSSTFNRKIIREQTTNNIYKKKAKGIGSYSGTIYTVVGSSSKLDNGPLNHPAMPHSIHEAGSMIIDVNKNILNAYFINKSADIKDYFKIIKDVQGGVSFQSCK